MTTATLEPEPEVDSPPPTIGGPLTRWQFGGALAGIVLIGLAFRVGYVMLVTRYENSKFYDAFWYGVTSNGFTQGQFFRVPFGTAPTAAHPPMTSLLIGGASFIIGRHVGSTSQRLVEAVLGAGVVLCVGLLGKAIAGPWVGLVAAFLAALAPNFWIPAAS